jgi:HEAT repeats
MTWSRMLLVPLALAVISPATPAGIFSRKPKSNPADRVPELLVELKTSQDEAIRTAAAEELRQYDPKSFPEIVNGLMDALAKDASPGVRSEAASSLGRLRPISQQAGYALEQAQNNDSAMRVRLAARQSLWQYHLVGYRGTKSDTPGDVNPQHPPAARGPGQVRETVEPPLAVPSSAPTPAVPVSRPMPGAPTQLIPVNPGLQPAPRAPETPPPARSAPSGNDGPTLPPPG